MTEAEMRKLDHLCADFSALTEENKEFALDISRELLVLQSPVPQAQKPVPPCKNGELKATSRDSARSYSEQLVPCPWRRRPD
jgi:hypothetical protein